MRLEQSIAGEEFDEDAANAPNITRIAPAQIKYDLRCSIMPCGDDSGVVFVVECRGTKVDKSDLGVK